MWQEYLSWTWPCWKPPPPIELLCVRLICGEWLVVIAEFEKQEEGREKGSELRAIRPQSPKEQETPVKCSARRSGRRWRIIKRINNKSDEQTNANHGCEIVNIGGDAAAAVLLGGGILQLLRLRPRRRGAALAHGALVEPGQMLERLQYSSLRSKQIPTWYMNYCREKKCCPTIIAFCCCNQAPEVWRSKLRVSDIGNCNFYVTQHAKRTVFNVNRKSCCFCDAAAYIIKGPLFISQSKAGF